MTGRPSAYSAAPLRRMAALVVLANLFVIGIIGLWLDASRRQYDERAAVTSRNLNALLAHSMAAEFDRIDQSLKTVADEIDRQTSTGKTEAKAMLAFMERQAERLPMIDGLRVTDAQGTVLFGTGGMGQVGISLADRDYFQALLDNPRMERVISKRIVGRYSGKWVIVFARRLPRSDDSFGGIVLAPVTVDRFTNQFSAIDVGPKGVVVMRGDASRTFDLLARVPFDDLNDPGRVSKLFVEMITAHPEGTTYQAHAGADDIHRTFTFQPIPGYPLITLVGIATEDAMVEWRREAFKMGLLAGAFALFSALGSRAILRSWKARSEGFEQFRTLLSSTGVGIIGIDTEDCCSFCNPAALALLGCGGESDLLGKSAHALFHHSRNDGTPYPPGECRLLSALDSEAGVRVDDEVFWRADGTALAVEYWAHRQVAQGRITGVVVTFADISERRAMELALREKTDELARSNADLEQFAYVASHDLREPLRMIGSYVALLERRYASLLDDDGRTFIAFARDGARRLDQLILGLLEFSRIGRDRPPMEPVDLRGIIDTALTNLAVAVTEAGARITLVGELPVVVGDRQELERLLQNLIGNAIKFRAPGCTPEVRIWGTKLPGAWRISVADNGIGIPEDLRERIFGIFQRLHNRDQYEGTGIGLAVCRKIVAHHGGTLLVADNAEGGSVFTITLPDRRQVDR